MVSVTQQDHVGEIGLAAIRPVDDVVRIGPGCRPLATWPLAMTISGIERATRRVLTFVAVAGVAAPAFTGAIDLALRARTP